MKNIKNSILGLLAAFVFGALVSHPVFAASFTASLSGNATFEDSGTLSIVVNNLTGFTGGCEGLCGFTATLDYDATKIEIVSISAANGFTLVQGQKLVFYQATGVASGSTVGVIKYKNKALANGESSTISLKNIIASDGTNDIPGATVSKSLTYKKAEATPPAQQPAAQQPAQTTTKPAATTNTPSQPASTPEPDKTAPDSAESSDKDSSGKDSADKSPSDKDSTKPSSTKPTKTESTDVISAPELPPTPALVVIVIAVIAAIITAVAIVVKKK